MQRINLNDVTLYVEENINTFHHKRIQGLKKLKLSKILERKNPYMFKAKNVTTAGELIKDIIDAHISSNEETLFGDWLEGLAIFINNKVYGGIKSGISGVDLEFSTDNVRYIVAIKSGPNWGNSSQVKKMISYFTTAKRTIRTSSSILNIVAVNGCCYGRDKYPDKGEYYKYCGQYFWKCISGEDELYTQIIEPLGNKAKLRNDEFLQSYSRIVNTFTKDFTVDFCTNRGDIDWTKLIQFNSQIV